MTKTFHVPPPVRIGNWFVTPLLRLGFQIGLIYLLTVRGRRTGQLRKPQWPSLSSEDGDTWLRPLAS